MAFPRKDDLKKRLEEKYSREHSDYLRAQVSAVQSLGLKIQTQDYRLFVETS